MSLYKKLSPKIWERKDIKTNRKKLKNNFEIYQIKF